MAIRFDMITEINDVEFDRMFNDCIDNMNAGSYPWEITPVLTGSNEEKRVYIKTCFQEFLNVASGVVFVCSEDGYALTISSGFVNGTHFEGHMILIGRNQAGSKSFMYHDDYHTAREAFWDEVNFVTWDFQTTGPGTAFHDHIKTVYDDVVANNPAWIENARFARGEDPSLTGTVVAGSANNSIIPEISKTVANNTIIVATAVTEHTLGNSSLKLTKHEQIETVSDEGE
jgi:hypothetical protein